MACVDALVCLLLLNKQNKRMMKPTLSILSRIILLGAVALMARSAAFSSRPLRGGARVAVHMAARSRPRRRTHPSRKQRAPLLHLTIEFSAAGSTNLTMDPTALEETQEQQQEPEDCPPGYFLDSVNECCEKLGPIGRVSQAVETTRPFKKAYRSISNLFGVDTSRISSLGVAFVLSYSILSQINGAITLSAAWYLSCKRTGLSPLVPGQWKSLLAAYGTIYALVQVIKPFRVAAAIAMSKLSKEFLEQTQLRLQCNKRIAIAVQYALGWVAWSILAVVGIGVASTTAGVSLWK